MKKVLSMGCVGLIAGLSLSACQELVETQPGTTVTPSTVVQSITNPFKGIGQPLASTTAATSTTTSSQNKPRTADGQINFSSTAGGVSSSTTTTTTANTVVRQPIVRQPAVSTTSVTTATTNTQVVGSQAIQVKTADGRTIVLYPGQTYYGPDGRLYVYDPNALPIVTTGY